MNMNFNHYASVFSWRYGSEEMQRIWSERHKYQLWRKIWVALTKVEQKAGLVSKKDIDDLVKHQRDIDIGRILEIEKETGHDVVSAIKEFAQHAKIGGGKIHLGATSMDIVDNADAIRTKEAMEIIQEKVSQVLLLFSKKIVDYADLPCLGYTHLQPAEPTTVGYRLSSYAQDLLIDQTLLQTISRFVKGKGMKGAVGTRASYSEVLKGTKMTAERLDLMVMKALGIDAFSITSQVYPRKIDFLVLSALASIASSLTKFATDLRFLQSPMIGEWSEPFGTRQVGSSAMPFKKNPVGSEKVCSLARYIVRLPEVVLENASLSMLERTLDDSANRRIILPEGFLATDEILTTATKIISGLIINKEKINYNLSQYGPFAATEKLIIAAVKKGANRQAMHELLRELSMKAWHDISKGKPNPLVDLLTGEKTLNKFLTSKEIKGLLSVSGHIGDAPERALKLAREIKRNVGAKGRLSKL